MDFRPWRGYVDFLIGSLTISLANFAALAKIFLNSICSLVYITLLRSGYLVIKVFPLMILFTTSFPILPEEPCTTKFSLTSAIIPFSGITGFSPKYYLILRNLTLFYVFCRLRLCLTATLYLLLNLQLVFTVRTISAAKQRLSIADKRLTNKE